jgi:hypothetical protein
MITLSIDVTKIDKSRIKEVKRKNGETAKFLDLVLFECKSEYSDFIVKQSLSKDERGQKIELPILGNAKVISKSQGKQASSEQPSGDGEPEETDEPPF